MHLYFRKNLFLLVLFTTLSSHLGFSQEVVCTTENRRAIAEKIERVKQLNEVSVGTRIITIASLFLETSYVANTLEISTTEKLVVNALQLDCTTFVENVLALNLLYQERSYTYEAYLKNLEKIRYKGGNLDGYGSRLHYYSEWFYDNEDKGILENRTAVIGGSDVKKQINFMSTHSNRYPKLENKSALEKIKYSENFLTNTTQCILPKGAVLANEHLIDTGDIIAITTSIIGLDIIHTGFAIRKKDSRIYLIHASTKGSVLISEVPLAAYLKGIKNANGIMVATVKE